MYKVSLIFDTGEHWLNKQDYFFHSAREAKNWLSFYRTVDNFVDGNGRSTPIQDSYMMRFTV